MQDSFGIIISRSSIQKERAPNLSNTLVPVGTLFTNNLPMHRLQSYYSSCALGCSSEFRHCDMHIIQHLKVIGITLKQTPRELSVL